MKKALLTLLTFALSIVWNPCTYAQSSNMQLGGRITDTAGVPQAGPVDLEVRFFESEKSKSTLGPVVTRPGVPLRNGVFQIEVELTAAERQEVFSGSSQVWFEITDITNGRNFPRQRFTAVPYAMRIPVNGDSLSFNEDGELTIDAAKLDVSKLDVSKMDMKQNKGTVNIGASTGDGKVEIKADPSADYTLQLPPDDGTVGDLLQTDGNGNLSWTSSGGANSNAGTLCIAGQYLDGDGTCKSIPTITNAESICDTGEYLDGDGTCRTNAYIVSNGGAVTTESDPNVTAFAKAALPTCGVGQVLKGDGTNLTCVADAGLTAETDPNVTAFAKAALPTCGVGQVLKGDGTSLSCVADAGLTAETDPNVTAFAKATLPTCGAGQVLKGDGTNLTCVADAGLTAETDPNVTAFAKAALPTCGAGEVLKGDGTSLSCVTDADTATNWVAPGTIGSTTPNTGVFSNLTANTDLKIKDGDTHYVTIVANADANYTLTLPVDDGVNNQVLKTDGSGVLSWTNAAADTNAATQCGTGEYLDGDWTCRTNAYIVSNGGAVTTESDPNVTAFAKAALPTCGAGQVLKGDGTSLSCVTDAGLTTETDPNVTAFAKAALPTCGAGQVLKGDGTSLSCVTDTGLTSESDPQVGANTTSYLPRWNGSALVTGSVFDNGTNVGIGSASPQTKLDVNGAIKLGTSATCDSNVYGAIRYSADSIQYCKSDDAWTDVSAPGGTNNTVISGWPDALTCNISNPSIGVSTLIPVHMPYSGTGLYNYRIAGTGSGVYSVNFNPDGSFNSFTGITTSDCNASIASLYSTGRAFNFAKGPAAQFLQNGNDAYYNAGNLGIGTSNPVTMLQSGSSFALTPGDIDTAGYNTSIYADTNIGGMLVTGGGTGGALGNEALRVHLQSTGAYDVMRVTSNNGEILVANGNGNVGIGTTGPDAKLHVAGDVKIGNSAAPCNSTTEGSMRYNSSTKVMQFCNGTIWTTPGGSTVDYILYSEDVGASGTTSITAGAWRTRTLSVEKADTGNHASRSGAQITLQPGKYRCILHAGGYRSEHVQARLANITDGTYTYGTPGHSNDQEYSSSTTSVYAYLDLAAAKVFEFQLRVNVSGVTGSPSWAMSPHTVMDCLRFQD